MATLIYVVDDDDISREMIADFLNLSGHRTVQLESGEALFTKLKTEIPDLILLDIRFQDDLDGFEVCRTLKSHPETVDVPVIFTSSLANPEDKVQAFDAGGVDYLSKPIQLKELSARITTHLTIKSLQQDLKNLNANLEREVTERTRELNRWASVFDATEIGMSIGNFETITFEIVNPAFARMHGYEIHELIGMPVAETIAPEDRHRIMPIRERVMKNGHGKFEMRQIRKDGSVFPVFGEVNYIPGAGSSSRFQTVIQDISEIEEARRALKESELRFRRLSDATFEGLCIIDGDNVVDANNQFLDMLGFEKGIEEETDLSNVLFDRGRGLTVRELDRGEGAPVELMAKARSGKMINVEVRSRSLSDTPGKIRVVAVRDITERIEAEKKAEVQRRQLIRADKMASLGTLVAGVAHEINNPNQTVLTIAGRLKKIWADAKPVIDKYYEENGDFLLGGVEYSKMKSKVPDLVDLIGTGSYRIKKIVTDLKNFYREEETRRHGLLQVNEVVSAAIDMTRNYIGRCTTAFESVLAPDMPKVMGNFQALEQVIVNLISNACQSLQDTSNRIMVSTRTESDTVFINVTDEGIGIPAEDLNRIFDPFYTTKRETGGTGLGLSISDAIAKEHGGEIVFVSTAGSGTSATITLPAASEKNGE